MLSTIYAAEILFRHETEARGREHALLASIRDRRHAEAMAARTAVTPRAVSIAEPGGAITRSARLTWPRPISVERVEATACAVR